ncbi:hypothetical protein AB6D60_22440 [Vibrio splendidus]
MSYITIGPIKFCFYGKVDFLSDVIDHYDILNKDSEYTKIIQIQVNDSRLSSSYIANNGITIYPEKFSKQASVLYNHCKNADAFAGLAYIDCNERDRHIFFKRSDLDYLIYVNSSPQFAYHSIVRLCRDIAASELEKNGGLLLHSAAVVNKENKVTLIFGDSGAGKTTTAVNYVMSGYRFLSNDKCLIDSNLNVYHFPYTNRIGTGTYRHVAKNINESPTKRRITSELLKFSKNCDRWGSREKLTLSNMDYVDLFSTKLVSKGKVERIVLPSLNNTTNPIYQETCRIPKDLFNRNILKPNNGLANRDYFKGFSQNEDLSIATSNIYHLLNNLKTSRLLGGAMNLPKNYYEYN